jgi:two-component system cell cycle response regulator DivK
MACKKRILIVEDNSDSRDLLALLLTRSGYEVAEATTGLAAIEQTRVTRPDLIIMDLGLPGITGDEATARLKADPSTRDIPVIVNTASIICGPRYCRWGRRDIAQAYQFDSSSRGGAPIFIIGVHAQFIGY